MVITNVLLSAKKKKKRKLEIVDQLFHDSPKKKKDKTDQKNASDNEDITFILEKKKTKKQKNKQLNEGKEGVETQSCQNNLTNTSDERDLKDLLSDTEKSFHDNMASHTKKKKKKKKHNEEDCTDSQDPITVSDSVINSEVATETSHTKKKKKKTKHQDVEEHVSTDTTDIHIENKKNDERVTVTGSDSVGATGNPMETSTQKKKKKKKHQEEEGGLAVEELAITDVSVASNSFELYGEPIYTPTKKKKRKKKHHDEEDNVTMETSEINCTDGQGNAFHATAVGEIRETSDVTLETKLAKKKKNKHQDEENNVSLDTGQVTVENRDASVCETVEISELSQQTNHTKRKTKQKLGDFINVRGNYLVNNMNGKRVDTATSNNTLGASQVSMEISQTDKKNQMRKTVSVELPERKKDMQKIGNTKTTTNQDQIKHSSVSVQTCGNRNQTNMSSATKEEMSEQTIKRPLRTSATDEVDDELLKELKEFIPNVNKKSTDQINKLLRYDLPRFRMFKEQGLTLRWGQYSEQENQQIRANLQDFLNLTGIDSLSELLFPDRFKDKAYQIRKLKKQYRFTERIAEGIPRTCEAVYKRARKMLDETNHLGRFTEDELLSLKRLHQLHGNDWKVISEKTGRSVYSLQKRYATLESQSGHWNEEEVLKLKRAIQSHLEPLAYQSPNGPMVSREQLCNNIPWKIIAEKVKDRSWMQCRLKWFNILKNKMFPGGTFFKRNKSGIQAKMDLISALYTRYGNAEEEVASIEWDEVIKDVRGVTPVCIQKTFRRLKTSRIPNWRSLTNNQIIKFLYITVFPQLAEMADGEQMSDQMEDRYRLFEIFAEERAPIQIVETDD